MGVNSKVPMRSGVDFLPDKKFQVLAPYLLTTWGRVCAFRLGFHIGASEVSLRENLDIFLVQRGQAEFPDGLEKGLPNCPLMA